VAVWPISPTGSTLQPMLTTTEFSVGQNHVAFGLRLNHGTFVANADVVIRTYALEDQHPNLRTEVRAFYKSLDGSEQMTRASLHTDRTSPVAGEEIGMEGMYVAQVMFDRPGPWVLEVFIAQDDGPVEVSRGPIEVLAAPRSSILGVPTSQSRH
jgi:hypothetical protein